jgi:hypothetical protein
MSQPSARKVMPSLSCHNLRPPNLNDGLEIEMMPNIPGIREVLA